MNSWLILFLAGIFEIVWSLSLKLSEGFTQPKATAVNIIALSLSCYFLTLACKELPISTAYTVWVGIGVIGTAIGSIFLFNETFSMLQIVFLTLIVIGIIGIKILGMNS